MPSMQSERKQRKRVYKQVYRYILNETHPGMNQRGVKMDSLKTSLCANGSLDVAQVETALKALGEQAKIQYGSGWIVPVVDKQYHRDAIGWLAERENAPKALIGSMNKAVQEHDW